MLIVTRTYDCCCQGKRTCIYVVVWNFKKEWKIALRVKDIKSVILIWYDMYIIVFDSLCETEAFDLLLVGNARAN